MTLPGFPHLVHGADYNPEQWLTTPGILAEDDRLMKLAHMNSATMGMFSWSMLEPEEGKYDFSWLDERVDALYKNGVYTVLGTPTGARPAWLDEKYPEVRRVSAERVRDLHGKRHNHCMRSPVMREKITALNTQLATRYKDHPGVILWHISNELNGECHCPICQSAFRDFLREKYHNDIDALNYAWWTTFWSRRYTSFDQIVSPAPHGEGGIHGLDLDWKRFCTESFRDYVLAETKPLREITPRIPICTNLMSGFFGIDYWKFEDVIDIVSWDSYPEWNNNFEAMWETAAGTAFYHDLFRALKRKPFLLMESAPSYTNWRQVNKLKRPGVHLLSSLQAVAHGSDSVQYFQFRKSRGSCEKFHGAVVDHVGHENTRVFRDVTDVGMALEKLDCALGLPVKAEVGILFDYTNKWAMDEFKGLDQRNRGYMETLQLHYNALWKQGIAADIVSQTGDLSGYKLIIAPMLYLMEPGIDEKLAAFVKNGGRLVTTYLSGYVDENDLCCLGGVPGGKLREVTGVWAEEIEAIFPEERNGLRLSQNPLGLSGRYALRDICEVVHAETAQVLGVYESDFYKDMPALTRNEYGRGLCYHMAARTEADFLDAFYKAAAKEAAVAPVLAGELPEGVSATARGEGESRIVFVMNFTEAPQEVTLPRGRELLTGAEVDEKTTLPPLGFLAVRG